MGIIKAKNLNNQVQSDTGGKLDDKVLLKSILEREYILIVGSEAILNKDLEGTNEAGDSNILMYNAMLDERGIQVDSSNWDEHHWQDCFRQNLMPADLYSRVENPQNKCIKYELNDISSSLESLIKTKYFPIVFTTSTDRYLETLMSSVWENLKVVNFYDNSSVDVFLDNLSECKTDPMRIMPPTLFYVFGKANYTSDGITKLPFVFSEDDAIDAIAKWIRVKNEKKKLFDYYSDKKIMAIGCRFCDWRFRFFWYAFRNDIAKLSQGTVAITFKETNSSDTSLRHYLTNENIHVEPDSRAFMDHLLELLNPKQNSTSVTVIEEILKKRRRNEGIIFISYAHEDFPIVYEIFTHLTNSGYNVWLDNKNLYSSDMYEKKIKDALSKCTIFMPILSEQVRKDLEADNLSRFYIKKEWSPIRDRRALNSVHVVPLAINSYNPREPYHNKFEEFWDMTNKEEAITIESVREIKHFKEGLDKILKQ